MEEKRLEELQSLQDSLGIEFNDIELFNTALMHSSYVNENPNEDENNEKLELFGDSVLAYMVNEYLYKNYTDSSEGELSRIKSIVVSEHSLAGIARKLEIGSYVLLGRGEQLAKGNERPAILADTLEAILGALCLDSNLDTVKLFFLPHIIEEIEKVKANKHQIDYKTNLQLLTQKLYKSCPIYETVSEDGPDHQKTFHVRVKINNNLFGIGSGSSKKSAQQSAAEQAIKELKNESD